MSDRILFAAMIVLAASLACGVLALLAENLGAAPVAPSFSWGLA